MKDCNIPNWVTYGILIIVAFLFVFLFSCTTSPFYERYPFWFHDDSGIFQEMGVCLLQGGTPYIDLFDHKGPILWFIQAFGLWISPHWGLMALQATALFCSMLLWYKSSLLLIEKRFPSLIIIVLGLFFLLAFYERGNLSEEWSLLFISFPIYLYLKRWKTINDTKTPIYKHIDTLMIGLCVGILAMIRLNNTAPIIGFVLWHFIRCIQQKDYKRLWTDVLLICSGIIFIFICCALYYFIKAGWSGVYEMIYGTFVFNFLYINSVGIRYDFITKLQFYIPPVGFLIINLISLKRNKQFSNVNVPIIISYFATLVAIGRFCYGHYLIICVPLFILSTCFIFKSPFKSNKIIYVILCCIIIECIRVCIGPLDLLLYRFTKEPPHVERHEGFHKFVSSLPEEEKHSIYNAGLNHMGAGLFADENIYQCNRIIFNGHLNVSSRLREYEETHGIKDLQPIWILTQSQRPETSSEYMATRYTLADSIPGCEFAPIWCWKRCK